MSKSFSIFKLMRVTLFLFLMVNSSLLFAQNSFQGEKPKLVVGIVVDQMRQEYLYRFYPKFSADGFKRLMGDGFVLKNAHYNYIPTITGPGHASVYTGTTPALHGIIANEFYDKQLKKMVNCANDPFANSRVMCDSRSRPSDRMLPRAVMTSGRPKTVCASISG